MSRGAGLRPAFVSARSAFVGDGGIWTSAANGRLMDQLRERFPRLQVALSRAPERRPIHDHRLAVDADDFVPLPFLPSLREGFARSSACRRIVRALEETADLLIIQLPFAAPFALLGARRPRLYHLCADVLAQGRTSPGYGGLRRLPAVAVGILVDRVQRAAIHRPRTRLVANGRQLFEHYGSPPGRAVVSSSLFAREIESVRRARPADAPFRVLFVGYLRPEKGFDTLVAAYDRLLADLPDAELEIVASSELAETRVEAQLQAAVARLRRRGTVRCLGPKRFGEELFRCFAEADVLAVPSRNEGTPRVLVEARAFGCPTVATRVGGIPTSVEDGVDGLLIPEDDPEALRRALLRVAREPELRRRLVAGGLERARRSTLEAFAAALGDEAELLA